MVDAVDYEHRPSLYGESASAPEGVQFLQDADGKRLALKILTQLLRIDPSDSSQCWLASQGIAVPPAPGVHGTRSLRRGSAAAACGPFSHRPAIRLRRKTWVPLEGRLPQCFVLRGFR